MHISDVMLDTMLAALMASFAVWMVVVVAWKVARVPDAIQQGESLLVGLLACVGVVFLALFLHGFQ